MTSTGDDMLRQKPKIIIKTSPIDEVFTLKTAREG
jgi:hypothetical protein